MSDWEHVAIQTESGSLGLAVCDRCGAAVLMLESDWKEKHERWHDAMTNSISRLFSRNPVIR